MKKISCLRVVYSPLRPSQKNNKLGTFLERFFKFLEHDLNNFPVVLKGVTNNVPLEILRN